VDKYLIALLVAAIFTAGWLISYGTARLLFYHDKKRKVRLENKIRLEDPQAMIIRRGDAVSSLYMIWGVHFIFLVLAITFCWVAVDGSDDIEFYASIRGVLSIAGFITLLSIGCSWLATVEYGYIVTVMNDQGIRQLKRGLVGYELKDSMIWSEIEGIDMEQNDLPRLILRGQGKCIAVFADCKNFDKLRKMLVSKVPEDHFDHRTYIGCSILSA
jgi:hypothetical protein